MAHEAIAHSPPGLVAAADLSTKQYRFVKLTGNNSVNIATAAGERVLGVLQMGAKSGEGANVAVLGTTRVVAGETIAAGQLVGTRNDGSAQVIEHTSTGADTGSWAVGVCLAGGASGEIITVELAGPVGYRVTA